jgi:type I restriction enzyme M protein
LHITKTIKSIQDILRKDAGLEGDPQRISQLVWMLFLKMFDDTEVENKTPIPHEFKWRIWTKKHYSDEGLIDFVNNELFPTLRALPDVRGQVPRAKLIEEIFKNSFNYITSGALMKQVILKLDSDFNFSKSENRHLFNDIYETILKDIRNSRYSGEYYTPQAVTNFIVEVLKPVPGEIVLDPACGTGGFLSSVTDHIKRQVVTNKSSWNEEIQSSIRGIEKKSLPYMLCVTNLLLHNIDVPIVVKDNAFSKPLAQIIDSDKVDLIVTNPPFGGIEEDNIVKNFSKEIASKETADLFLLLIMDMLKPNGRAGIVLPDGFLFGTGIKTKIKEKLLRDFNVNIIYRLPRGVFSPYTDINTNILFFEKNKKTKHVWFYEHPLPSSRDGRPYNKSNPIMRNEFDAPVKWIQRPFENEHAWQVSIEEIANRKHNLDFKNPNVEEEKELNESTEEIMEEIFITQKRIDQILRKIKNDFF